jgi:glutamate/tyrosine decarboxylase-like PLP-dependent enzyme
MSSSAAFPDDTLAVLAAVGAAARRYLDDLEEGPVRSPGADAAASAFDRPLPQDGIGALRALAELEERGFDGAIRSSGPRMFHFVTGGGTPAALGADWLTSLLDQNSFSWIASPLGARLERLTIAWLKELFELPAAWGGVLTTGATMANFTALACARQWWGDGHGVDIAADGFAGLPAVPVLTGGHIHASAEKALAMLGVGRSTVRRFVADGRGTLDLAGLEDALRGLDGRPAIIIATAGEVNAGAFDPLEALADLAERHGAWLHVDGAFGLFARVSPASAGLVAGLERAHSAIADGHKWLNVPYDCGFAFVRDATLPPRVFTMNAAYLPGPDDPHPNYGFLGPEASRRARALPVWATLAAYGRTGYRALVERHLALAERVAGRVRSAPDLELLAGPGINVVCFRFRPPGVVDEAELNVLNERLGEAVLEDGRVYVGTTRYDGRIAFRPAIANWRTTEADVDLLVDVIRELGASISTEAAGPP